MSPRRLEDVFSVTIFSLPRRFQEVFKMSSRRRWRRFEDQQMFAGIVDNIYEQKEQKLEQKFVSVTVCVEKC